MNFSDRVKNVRVSQSPKQSQAEFGAKLGVSRDVINNLERGRVEPSEALTRLICSTYGVEYAWLKDGIGPMTLPPDTDDELVDAIMAGSNEFARNVMKAFARAGKENPALWDALGTLLDELKKVGR